MRRRLHAYIALIALAALSCPAPGQSQQTTKPGTSGNTGSSSGNSGTSGSSGGRVRERNSGSSAQTERAGPDTRTGAPRRTAGERGNAAGGTVGRNAEGTEGAPRSSARRTTAKSKSSSGGYTGAKASATAISSMAMSIDRSARVMRLVPPMKADGGFGFDARKGDEFWTHVQIESQSPTTFDTVRIVLSYPPDVVELTGINDHAIAKGILGEATAGASASSGRVVYEAQLNPTVAPNGPMVSFRWKALRKATNVPIEFSHFHGKRSALLLSGGDLLGNASDPTDGTLAVDFDVLPSDAEELAELEDAAAFDFGSFERKGNVKLRAVLQEAPVVAGEVFTIDLVLDNSAGSALDGLEVNLAYDPEVLHIVDADLDNAVTVGTNILDGPFSDVFPFDFHIDNSVYPSMGRIRYAAGIGNQDALRGLNGTFARIYCLAKRPVSQTYLKFMFGLSAGYPSTRATFVGEDVLGDPTKPHDGTESLVFGIRASRPAAVDAASTRRP